MGYYCNGLAIRPAEVSRTFYESKLPFSPQIRYRLVSKGGIPLSPPGSVWGEGEERGLRVACVEAMSLPPIRNTRAMTGS